MIDWIAQYIPTVSEYEFLAYLTAYVLLAVIAIIILSFFVGIFTAIFRRY